MLNKPKILIHCHIFYLDQLDLMLSKIANFKKYDYDLFVTFSESTINNENKNKIFDKIKIFNDKVNFSIFPNKGHDTGPFTMILNKVNLDNYDYIAKMHTKRRTLDKKEHLNGLNISGSIWADNLLSIFDSEKIIDKIINIFEKKQKIGLICDCRVIVKKPKDKFLDRDLKLLHQMNLDTKKYYYPAGTMFFCRAKILKPIQLLNLDINDFPEPKDDRKGMGVAYGLEANYGLMTLAQGYKIKGVYVTEYGYYYFKIKMLFGLFYRALFRFIYQNKISKKGHKVIKIFKIPIYYKKEK